MWRHRSLTALCGAAFAAVAGAATPWDGAFDAASQTRFIPVELWTGAPWDGQRILKMAPAALAFGNRGEKHVAGPLEWTRPGTGETLQVYERGNGAKRQLFTLTSRGDGLGRVFDSRYGRDCIDEVKFPLGLWKQGEVRAFDVLCNQGRLHRRLEVRIEEIDFSWGGVPHSLKFHWLVDGGRQRGTDMHYIYSPGRGLVSVQGNE
ncbi:MAG: hypothetical protein HYX47_00910 [Burkholderiales bacterium]|nr:hypothetical protein [Burkholderiales bacterium]